MTTKKIYLPKEENFDLMNKSINKNNILSIVVKSVILAALLTLIENWRQDNLILNFSFNEITAFKLRFLISFFVLLIIEVLRETNKKDLMGILLLFVVSTNFKN